MILKHRHTCLVVKDLVKVRDFYKEFGFVTGSLAMEGWGEKDLIVQKLFLYNKLGYVAGATIELVQGPWRNHICFEVDELPDGPYVHEKITDDFHTVFIEDPEGNLIELTKIKEV